MRSPSRFGLRALVTAFALLMLAASCAQDTETPQATTGEGEETTIAVTLQEWSVIPEESSAPEGELTFDVENAGEKNHEFMVVATDLGLTELPTTDDGSFDMEADDVEVIDASNAAAHGGGNHAELKPDAEQSFSYELDAGNYVLVCNLVDESDEKEEVHFKLGMRIPFEVT